MSWRKATLVCIRILSADVEGVLKRLNDHGIMLANIQIEGPMQVAVYVGNKEYLYTIKVLKRYNINYELPEIQQTSKSFKWITSRSFLLMSIAFLIIVAIYVPGKILFVSVIGNNAVETRRILEAANKNGIYFGASTANVRSEKVKNAILQNVPQLQWLGVNTNGCVARIFVVEKNTQTEKTEPAFSISSLIASRDGIVESCTVTRGTMLCSAGKAVLSGDVLISGYSDCGNYIRATKAEGEVYARTIRKINALMPKVCTVVKGTNDQKIRYGLKIGKKLINFDNSSGIYHGSCAKIYEEQSVVLPGGHILPISFFKETTICYQTAEDGIDQVDDSALLLQTYCEQYLKSDMVSGELLDKSVHLSQNVDVYLLSGRYVCSELISRQRSENIIQGE